MLGALRGRIRLAPDFDAQEETVIELFEGR
jgi:hypothetical protein